jgi:SAM-dependent methyltransferase
MTGLDGLPETLSVADIGSGTGISAEPLLRACHKVYCIEPNPDMRSAAERGLAEFAGYVSVAATAEQTQLPDSCVDLVLCAQSFHWFDAQRAMAEFRRIGRPHAWVALMWYSRRLDGSAFLTAYEALLQQHAVDYNKVSHRARPEMPGQALGPAMRSWHLTQERFIDLECLLGGIASASYMPGLGESGHEKWVEAARGVFAEHQSGGTVRMVYDVNIHAARLRAD